MSDGIIEQSCVLRGEGIGGQTEKGMADKGATRTKRATKERTENKNKIFKTSLSRILCSL